jgi:hypothetical protein
MGEYKQSLSHAEWLIWKKDVKKWLIDHDWSVRDLAEAIGYSAATCFDALNQYERCSKFFIAAVNEKMETT